MNYDLKLVEAAVYLNFETAIKLQLLLALLFYPYIAFMGLMNLNFKIVISIQP
jgi:hypothetical protein